MKVNFINNIFLFCHSLSPKPIFQLFIDLCTVNIGYWTLDWTLRTPKITNVEGFGTPGSTDSQNYNRDLWESRILGTSMPPEPPRPPEASQDSRNSRNSRCRWSSLSMSMSLHMYIIGSGRDERPLKRQFCHTWIEPVRVRMWL